MFIENSGSINYYFERKRNNVKIQTEIVESTMSAQETIVKYAEEHNVDVIVVGTRGMSGFAKQLLGSTA
jgi:nucleotide-binding universal stress UspA family protein